MEECETADNKALVKLYISNAFNTVLMDVMLEAVKTRAPMIYTLVWQGYSDTTPLYR